MNDKQKARWEEVRHSIGLAICCLIDVDRECDRCATGKGCPDTWPDVAEQVDKILNLKDSAGNYLVEVADPDQSLPSATKSYAEKSDKGILEGRAYVRGYYTSQSDMAGFKKCMPREG